MESFSFGLRELIIALRVIINRPFAFCLFISKTFPVCLSIMSCLPIPLNPSLSVYPSCSFKCPSIHLGHCNVSLSILHFPVPVCQSHSFPCLSVRLRLTHTSLSSYCFQCLSIIPVFSNACWSVFSTPVCLSFPLLSILIFPTPLCWSHSFPRLSVGW